MELVCLAVVGITTLILIGLSAESEQIDPSEYLRALQPTSTLDGPWKNKAVSGMQAQRQRREEVTRVVTAEPDRSAQTVKEWMME